MKPASIKPVRCAIYTRVSTEHFRLRDKWPSDQGPETTCTLRALDAVKHSTAPPRPPPHRCLAWRPAARKKFIAAGVLRAIGKVTGRSSTSGNTTTIL